ERGGDRREHRRRADRPAQPRGEGSPAVARGRAGPRMIAAIVPAAGRSERMGRPKLTLPVGGTTVIARVVSGLREGGAGRVIVVAPPVEIQGAEALIAEAKAHGAEVVVPKGPTADMRASVELGLARLGGGKAPEGVLLAPGDSPGITAELVTRVVAHFARD